MQLTKMTPNWGVVATSVTFDELMLREPSEEFKVNGLRRLLYDYKVLVFRGLGQLSRHQVMLLASRFGTVWSPEQYDLVKDVDVVDGVMTFSNKTDVKSMNASLPWHRDIGWYREMKYPIRVLCPTQVDDKTEPTVFMDATAAFPYMTNTELLNLSQTEVLIQHLWSWNPELKRTTTEPKWIPLVEEHPYTRRKELLLDSFGPRNENQRFSTKVSAAWLLDARIMGDDGPRAGTSFLNRLHVLAHGAPGNVYAHKWLPGDYLLFDNQSGIMHRRGPIMDEKAVREFYRVNINHMWQKQGAAS